MRSLLTASHSRRIGRLGLVLGLSLLSTLVFAQSVELNPLAKQQVLEQVSDVITKSAFVPGLDFKKWPEPKPQKAIVREPRQVSGDKKHD